MSAQIECPICMECIDMTKNCITTECGHFFHTNCLMANVAHNGFNCPYCRTKMAEEPESDDEDYEEDENDEDDEEDENDEDDYEFALRGFRFFWNNLNGEEDDRDDLREEFLFNYQTNLLNYQTNNAPEQNIPISLVTQKLQQHGFTYEQLVSMLLVYHIYYGDNEEICSLNHECVEKIYNICHQYKPQYNTSAPVTPLDHEA